MKDEIKKSLFPNFLKGLSLLVITTPFLFGVILKFFYKFSQTHNTLNTGIIPSLFENSSFVRFCWKIAPNPTSIFNYILIVILLIAFGLGLGLIGKSYNNLGKLDKAKRVAAEQQLIEDYKK